MKISLLAFTFALVAAASHAIAAPAEADAGASKKPVPIESYILAAESRVFVAGQTYESYDFIKMEVGKIVVTTPQGDMEGTMEMSEIKITRFKVETAEKVKILIEKSEAVNKSIMNGHVDAPEPAPKPLVGIPVTATLADGKWTAVRDDGAEPAVEEAKELKTIARDLSGILVRKMYGTEPRKPGDHWTVDAKDTIFNEDANMTNTSGKVELTFDKVADYKGMKCAFLSGTIQISGTPGDLPAEGEGKLKMTSKVVIVRALEQQMDLDAKMTGTMEMQRKLPDGRSMRIIGPLTLHSETKMF